MMNGQVKLANKVTEMFFILLGLNNEHVEKTQTETE